MALRYVNPRSGANGDGLTWATAYNTFAGLSWGAHTYLVGGGTLQESISLGINGASVIGMDPADMPVIDASGLGTSTSAVNLNSRTGCTVANLKIVNSVATSPNAAVRVSGSGNKIHSLVLKNNRAAIQVNSGAHQIYKNYIDIGTRSIPTVGYGIRLNSSSATGVHVFENVLVCTSLDGATFSEGGTFRSGIESYQSTGNFIYRNTVKAPFTDQILILESSATEVFCNKVGGVAQMLDGISVRQSSTITVTNNTAIHVSMSGHAGPAFGLADNFGIGTISTNCIVKNNAFITDGNIPFAYKPLGTGNVFANNLLWKVGGDGDAVVNYQAVQGGAISSLNLTDWLAVGLDTDSFSEDPLITSSGMPKSGSGLLTGGADLGYVRDRNGRQGRSYVGCYTKAVSYE